VAEIARNEFSVICGGIRGEWYHRYLEQKARLVPEQTGLLLKRD
jgi:hypothetical protein